MSVNWLILITVCMVVSALFMFYFSIKDTIGIKQCIYGDNGLGGTCNSENMDSNVNSASPNEFSGNKLVYTYDFISYLDEADTTSADIRFANISQEGEDLKVVIERRSVCDSESNPAPQGGFFKEDGSNLILTVTTNLVNTSYNTLCITEGTFTIYDFVKKFDTNYKVFYQDEYDTLTPALNCVHDGYLRNTGDVYQTDDGCYICTCKDGVNSCEETNSCLK